MLLKMQHFTSGRVLSVTHLNMLPAKAAARLGLTAAAAAPVLRVVFKLALTPAAAALL
jgi:hypothetical protein